MTSFRAAATARGSTTRWKTRSSPAATSPRARTRERADDQPDVSIVIPVYNEEGILHASVVELVDDARRARRGTTRSCSPRTARATAPSSSARSCREQVSAACRSTRSASRTTARRSSEGILRARGELVICDEIDLCDIDFYQRALAHPRARRRRHGRRLARSMKGAERRPAAAAPRGDAGDQRHAARALGFHGTDTHGLKAFRRERAARHRRALRRSTRDLFAREFVIRAGRDGKRVHRDPDPHRREAAAVDQPVQARAERVARHRAADLYHPRQRLTEEGPMRTTRVAAVAVALAFACAGGAYAQKKKRRSRRPRTRRKTKKSSARRATPSPRPTSTPRAAASSRARRRSPRTTRASSCCASRCRTRRPVSTRSTSTRRAIARRPTASRRAITGTRRRWSTASGAPPATTSTSATSAT